MLMQVLLCYTLQVVGHLLPLVHKVINPCWMIQHNKWSLIAPACQQLKHTRLTCYAREGLDNANRLLGGRQNLQYDR